MENYNKPSVLANEEMAEGVYMASGDGGGGEVAGGAGCDSIYMKGVYKVMTTHPTPDGEHMETERGCEGCPADWGFCALNSPDFTYGDTTKPWWERDGLLPTDGWDT